MKMRRTCALLVVIAVLLAGCRSGCEEEKNSRPEETSLDCFVPRNDEGTDSIREYYERMEIWEALHGGMCKWESNK
jgi:hypothetical protein